jgi:carbon storage regulator
MLVLTRRSGESIIIGEQIVVTVLEVRGDHVRIGIKAPRSVQVHREEVLRRVEGENAAAAASAERARALLANRPLPPRRPPGSTGGATDRRGAPR